MPTARHDDPAIEALRGIAALMVVTVHYARFLTSDAGAWGVASTGVDLFFVLSGYVFAPYFFGKPLELAPHLVRRFFRLYPLYVCALLTYVVLKLPDPSAWRHFWSHLFMLHTLGSLDVAFFYNPAFWSLPPEVEFYLLLPLLAVLMRHWRFGWLLIAALAMHLVLVAAAQPGEGTTARAVATVHLPGLLIEFALGAWAWSAARAYPSRRAARARLFLGLAWLAGVALAYALLVAPKNGIAESAWVGGNVGLAAALGYAALVSALATRADTLVGWRLRGCLIAGQLSYAVYLFHNAAAQSLEKLWPGAAGWPAALASLTITLLVAFALHHAIEAPARNFGRQLSRRIGTRLAA
ncbi:MAG TPA: acyltransferase [Ramlibacter sp.]|nr:acyltransferase [Ramlibacter sp.]